MSNKTQYEYLLKKLKVLTVHLEEGAVRALPPKAFRARLVVTVLLIDLQVSHLEEGSENYLYSGNL